MVLIYAVAITNSLTEQLAKHIQIDIRIRMLVSFGVVLILNMIFNGKTCHYSRNGLFGLSAYRLLLVSFAILNRKLATLVTDRANVF